jgi:hypothetical protein
MPGVSALPVFLCAPCRRLPIVIGGRHAKAEHAPREMNIF